MSRKSHLARNLVWSIRATSIHSKSLRNRLFSQTKLRKKCGSFWAILGHSWAILGLFGPFWVIFGPLWAILGHFWDKLWKICGKFKIFCGIVVVAIVAFRMYAVLMGGHQAGCFKLCARSVHRSTVQCPSVHRLAHTQ